MKIRCLALPLLVGISSSAAADVMRATPHRAEASPGMLRLVQDNTNNGASMTISLPAPLEAAVNAINNADTDAFVAAFAENGSINDWGRVLRGHAGARSWAQSDAIGAGAKMTIVSAETTGNVTHITFGWTSRVFNGQSQAYVTVENGLITEFRIPSH